MLISVVIPLYNKAHTIVNTLNTVIRQTYRDYEVIIVNDGSTDDGVAVIEKHFKDSRIRIVNQENAGVSVARNRGVDEAKGEYVAFLDADDEWHPGYLAAMVELINKFPQAGLLLCGGLIKYADGRIFVRIAKGYENYLGRIQLFQNPEVFSHTSATIVNRDKFNKTHRFISDMCKYEDFLASQTLALTTDVVYCGLPLTKYVGGVEGQLTQMNQTNPKAEDSVVLYYNQLVKNCIDAKGGIDELLHTYLVYNLRHSFKLLAQKGQLRKIIEKWDALSTEVRGLFPIYEMYIPKKSIQLYILYINITKIFWRMRGYPRMLQIADLSKFDQQLLNW